MLFGGGEGKQIVRGMLNVQHSIGSQIERDGDLNKKGS